MGVLYIIEYNGLVYLNDGLNNRHVLCDVNQPLILNYPNHIEIKVLPEPTKIIEINKSVFIIRPFLDKVEKIVKQTQNSTIESLNTVLGHVLVANIEGELKECYVALPKDFKFKTPYEHELGIAFLQCIKYKDFENAHKMLGESLSNNISIDGLKDFCRSLDLNGEFDVLINNYLNDYKIVSVLSKNSTKARQIKFEFEDGKISNIAQQK